jgi:hypothetical protein
MTVMRINPTTKYDQKKVLLTQELLQKYLLKISILFVLSIEVYFFIKMLI